MRVTGMVGSYKLRYKFLGNYQFVSLHTDTEQVDGAHKQPLKLNSVHSCYLGPSDCHNPYIFIYDLAVFIQFWPSLARWTHLTRTRMGSGGDRSQKYK